MPYVAGHEEDKFLQSLGVTMDEIEPLASQCTEIFVWHTQTKKATKGVIKKIPTSSNIGHLVKTLKSHAMA